MCYCELLLRQTMLIFFTKLDTSTHFSVLPENKISSNHPTPLRFCQSSRKWDFRDHAEVLEKDNILYKFV